MLVVRERYMGYGVSGVRVGGQNTEDKDASKNQTRDPTFPTTESSSLCTVTERDVHAIAYSRYRYPNHKYQRTHKIYDND